MRNSDSVRISVFDCLVRKIILFLFSLALSGPFVLKTFQEFQNFQDFGLSNWPIYLSALDNNNDSVFSFLLVTTRVISVIFPRVELFVVVLFLRSQECFFAPESFVMFSILPFSDSRGKAQRNEQKKLGQISPSFVIFTSFAESVH